MNGRFLFRKIIISAFPAVNLLPLSSILEAVLESLTLSTLAQGALRNLARDGG